MIRPTTKTAPRAMVKLVRCAIYTRKSTEEGLDQEFNSLDAQREAGEAYVRSQPGDRRQRRPGRHLVERDVTPRDCGPRPILLEKLHDCGLGVRSGGRDG